MDWFRSGSIIYLLLILAVSSCENYPRDPNETLKKVTNGRLVVGITHEPSPEKMETVVSFARSLNAGVKWEKNTEENLFEKLKENEIHLLISDLSMDTPWKDHVALAADKKMIFALPPGENAFIMKFEHFLFETLGKEQK